MVDIKPREFWIDPNDTPWDGIVTQSSKGQIYKCPKRVSLDGITEIVVHYPGSDWNSMDFTKDGNFDINDTVFNVRKGHRDYLRGSRGYSYGYGWVVGQDGIVLTGRGFDCTNAANAGDEDHNSEGWNGWSISMQILVDLDQPANAKQLQAANELIALICSKAKNIKSLVWHGFRQYTACCGPVIDQVKKGLIHLPTNEPLPIPPLPDFPEIPIYPIGDDMSSKITQIVRVKGATFAVVDNGVSKFWIPDGDQVNHVAANAAKAGSVGVYDGANATIHEVTERLGMLGLGPVTNALEPSSNSGHGGQNLIQLGWDQFGWKP